MKQAFFNSESVRLHYIDWGGSGRPIVLLAGLGDNAQIYRGLAPRLAGRYRILALTRRGHGRSDRPACGYRLDTFVDDVRCLLDHCGIGRAVLAGHSFGGFEMPLFATHHPRRVEALVFLDALFPRLDPEPDLSGDPVGCLLPREEPDDDDLASRQSYLAHCRRAAPAKAALWCEAIEADFMDRVTARGDGSLEYRHDDALMNRIYRDVWPARNLEYGQVRVPMLAVTPDGSFHPDTPQNVSDDVRRAADRFWRQKLRPWIRQRTEVFRAMAPAARVVELDSPYHHIYLAEEERTAAAIVGFLGGGD